MHDTKLHFRNEEGKWSVFAISATFPVFSTVTPYSPSSPRNTSAGHVFVTIAYGRSYIGDAPYLLEDDDIGATGNAEGVYTFAVRGDF